MSGELARLLARQVAAIRRDAADTLGRVTALNSDGTANVEVRGGLLVAVPCLASYNDRARNDVVVVRRVGGGGGFYVAGRIGPPSGHDHTAVTWGTAAPGGTWRAASTVYVRDGAVYAQTSTASTPPQEAPTVIDPAAQGTWRDGRRRGDVSTMVQGFGNDDTGVNTGATFYGDTLTAAVTAATVHHVTLDLARTHNRHGDPADVATHLYVHTSPAMTAARPALVYGPWHVCDLQLGEMRTVTLPAAAVTALQADGRGVAVYASRSDGDYIRYGPCGRIRVYYS